MMEAKMESNERSNEIIIMENTLLPSNDKMANENEPGVRNVFGH